MSARTEIAAFFIEKLPMYRVIPFGRVLDGTDKVTLMVKQATVRPGQTQGLRSTDVVVQVIVPGEDPERVETALEDALDEVLDVLDGFPALSYSEAERAVREDAFHCYELTLSVTTKKETL